MAVSQLTFTLNTNTTPEKIIILTDSQSSMHLINTMLHYPNKLKHHKHKFLIKTITNHLILGAETNRQQFTFCKVRAHVGIKGNEMADKAATNPQQINNIQILTDNGNPLLYPDSPNIKPTWIKIPEQNNQQMQWRSPTSSEDIKQAIATTSRGNQTLTNKSKKIKDLLADDEELKIKFNTSLDTSILTNHKIPQPLKSLALKLRMRNLYTTQLAAQMSQSTEEQVHRCSLCNSNKKETQGHILGGCTHQIMHAITMQKHGKAVGLILDSLETSNKGNIAIFADAETGKKTLHNISRNLLPRDRRAVTKQHELLSKPDIIIFPKILQSEAHTTPPNEKKEAIFLEISFTGDGYAATRFEQKLKQHEAHAEFLRSKEWTIKVIPIIFTHSGCLTTSLRQILTEFGIENGPTNKLISKLQLHTCTFSYKTISTYRQLKKQQQNEQRSGIG
jgi:hypothetical protein